MLKKLLAITITAVLITPQNAVGLRPVSVDNSYAQKAAFWPETPEPITDNPYTEDRTNNSGFGYGHRGMYNLCEEIELMIRHANGTPIKILLIGIGGGFEAFSLMQRYGDNIDITATSLEDLLCRSADKSADFFKKTGNRAITLKQAQSYIDRLRKNKRYLRQDMDDKLPMPDGTYDIAFYCHSVSLYIGKKIPALEETIRVTKTYGVIYSDLGRTNIIHDGAPEEATKYIDSLDMPGVSLLSRGNMLKIVKIPGFKFPKFEQTGKIQEEMEKDIKVPYKTTTYRLVSLPSHSSEPGGETTGFLAEAAKHRKPIIILTKISYKEFVKLAEKYPNAVSDNVWFDIADESVMELVFEMFSLIYDRDLFRLSRFVISNRGIHVLHALFDTIEAMEDKQYRDELTQLFIRNRIVGYARAWYIEHPLLTEIAFNSAA
ncbi:MAG: class I SAM-dependent methyltransferase [Candidatus Omnitrophota bacterium]